MSPPWWPQQDGRGVGAGVGTELGTGVGGDVGALEGSGVGSVDGSGVGTGVNKYYHRHAKRSTGLGRMTHTREIENLGFRSPFGKKMVQL